MEVKYRQTLVRIKDVSLAYGNNLILRDINVEIGDIIGHGQVAGLLGPSGVGKTSLLRIMAGFQRPTTGTVTVTNAHEEPVVRGMVGVVAQNYPLLKHRTVYGNLLLAAKMKSGASKTGVGECVDEILQRFKMSEHAKKYPSQLSGGQRQRIAIAQQMLCSEHYILMDEPFSGLDLIAKRRVCRLIQEVADLSEQNTIIVVTHDVQQAVAVADTIWMMGRDKDAGGHFKPGAYIKKTYNLAERGLAWTKDLTRTTEYADCVREVEAYFEEL